MITADCESLRSAVGYRPMRCARLATGLRAIESLSTSGEAGSEASRATGWTPCLEIGAPLTPTLFNAGWTLCANSASKSKVVARDQPDAVAAIHLATPGLAVAPGPRTPHEEDFAHAVKDWTSEEGGYMHEHATKPATLAAGLSDSPAGLAAWIGEKIVAWSSTRPDGSPAFDRELLLATLTLYWTTETIATSLLPYWAHRHLAGAALPTGDVSPVPTAISIFGGERVPFPKPPRELAERYYNVTSWAEHPTGGHFPAVAEPELLAQSLRDAFRPMR
jgi:hypothetical protein